LAAAYMLEVSKFEGTLNQIRQQRSLIGGSRAGGDGSASALLPRPRLLVRPSARGGACSACGMKPGDLKQANDLLQQQKNVAANKQAKIEKFKVLYGPLPQATFDPALSKPAGGALKRRKKGLP